MTTFGKLHKTIKLGFQLVTHPLGDMEIVLVLLDAQFNVMRDA
jgi:hypothetical protein